jgi:hypothetical protein
MANDFLGANPMMLRQVFSAGCLIGGLISLVTSFFVHGERLVVELLYAILAAVTYIMLNIAHWEK